MVSWVKSSSTVQITAHRIPVLLELRGQTEGWVGRQPRRKKEKKKKRRGRDLR